MPIDVGPDLVKRLAAERPEVAFVAMHGVGGEDGTLQELLEILGIPFTGPGAAACARCMDKVQAKDAIDDAGLPTPHWSAFSYDDRVLLERFVDGRELAVSILGDEPLPVVEAILLEGDRYDFEARYEIGRTRFACPAELSAEEERAVTEVALATYRALGCTGFARVDLILGDEGPWLLEANAIPGLTDTSLLPQAAEAAGLSFEQLVERILDLALEPAAA